MHQYRVELRTGYMSSKKIDITADSHRHAAYRAKKQSGLLVLSTEFIA